MVALFLMSLVPSVLLADPVRLSGSIAITTLKGPCSFARSELSPDGSLELTAIDPEGQDFYSYCNKEFPGCLPGDTLQFVWRNG